MGTGGWMVLAGVVAMAPPATDPVDAAPARLCVPGVARPADLASLDLALRALIRAESPEGPACARRLVAEGLPTASLLVLLDALHAAPAQERSRHREVAWELAHHRRASVRSRALPVLAAAAADGDPEGGGVEWSLRAVTLALTDPAPEVRAVGFRMAVDHPARRFEGPLLDALSAGELDAAPALAACASPGLLARLPGLRAEIGEVAWTRLVGALLRRPGALTPIQRLALVTTLAGLGTAESQDQLRAFLRSGVGASPPVARNLAARALGMRQAPPVAAPGEAGP